MPQDLEWKYIVAASILFCSASLHASDRLYRNEEYAFQVAVPRDHHVCSDAHGLVYNIDRKPKCVRDAAQVPGQPAAITIWASYNAGFATSIYSEPERCKRSPLGLSLRRELRNRVRTWGTCVSHMEDGRTELSLDVMTGSYDRSWGEEAGKPCLTYSMSLRTYPNRFNRDLIEFRKFLRQVKLPGSCGDLDRPTE